jgi:hypothetical protein
MARLDADGDPMTQSNGDLQGAVGVPVEPGSDGVEVVLGSPVVR